MDNLNYEVQTECKKSEKKGKKAVIIVIAAIVLLLVVVGVVIIGNVVKKDNQYKEALALLDGGDIAEAVEIYKQLGNYKDLESQICDTAEDEFEDHLDEAEYRKAVRVYAAVKEYNTAVEELDVLLEDHVEVLFRNDNYDGISELYHQVTKKEVAVETVSRLFAEEIKGWLKDNKYENVTIVYEMVSRQSDDDIEAVCKVIYDHACTLLDNDNYDTAIMLLEELNEYKDSKAKLEEAVLLSTMELMRVCLKNKEYDYARQLLDSFEGESFEELLEIYLPYCADATFVDDLEKAMKARAELIEQEELDYKAVIDAEWEYLEKYWELPFYDERLEELAFQYMNALEDQEESLDYSDGYEWYYYWNMSAAERYLALESLNKEYGYDSEHVTGASDILGTGESMKKYWQAWWTIYQDVAPQLWEVSPKMNAAGQYYIPYTNHTEYTIDLMIYEEFYTDDGSLVSSQTGEYFDIVPDEDTDVIVEVPDYFDIWYLDFECAAIYLNGVELTPDGKR